MGTVCVGIEVLLLGLAQPLRLVAVSLAIHTFCAYILNPCYDRAAASLAHFDFLLPL